MKTPWGCLLVLLAAFAHSQSGPTPASAAHLSIADFGLVYPLSNDWIRATTLSRKTLESSGPAPNFDILLAAVYVPKSDISGSSPFFSLFAYRQTAADCKKSLEATIAHYQDNGNKSGKPEGGVEQFSAAGRDYFRLNFAHGIGGRHRCIICTVADGHLLVWNAGAPNEKGLGTVLATLNAITPLPPGSATESSHAAEPKIDAAQTSPSKPDVNQPTKVRVGPGVTAGLLIKKVNPVYPPGARAAYIQGTIVLRAEISKTGDVVDLELVDGPIELAGSAVAAVRQWKYQPYLLAGQPVAVDTQIQVNYELRR